MKTQDEIDEAVLAGRITPEIRQAQYDAAKNRQQQERDRVVLSAVDMLAVQLANHHHQWSNDQRGLYEHAVELLKGGEIHSQPMPGN